MAAIDLARAADLHRQATIINGLGIALTLDEVVGPMIAGGVTAVNWTIAAPGILVPNDTAGVVNLIATVRRQLSDMPERARLVETVEDIRAAKRDGAAGVILGFQDIGPIGESLDLLEVFHTLGVRIVQLSYQRRGLWGDGSGEGQDAGVSDIGREAIERMNRLGILIDLSHSGPRTSREAIDASAAPVSFTHTAAAAIVARPRTKPDDLLRHLGERDGVVGIIGISAYLDANGNAGTTVDRLVDHVIHVGELIGIDRVGIGLDILEGMTRDYWEMRVHPSFQGLPGLTTADPFRFETYYPERLRSMADVERITERLCARGLTDDEVLGVMGENFLRLFETVWAGA